MSILVTKVDIRFNSTERVAPPLLSCSEHVKIVPRRELLSRLTPVRTKVRHFGGGFDKGCVVSCTAPSLVTDYCTVIGD